MPYAETIAEAVQETENRSRRNSAKTGTLGPADSAAEINGLRDPTSCFVNAVTGPCLTGYGSAAAFASEEFDFMPDDFPHGGIRFFPQDTRPDRQMG